MVAATLGIMQAMGATAQPIMAAPDLVIPSRTAKPSSAPTACFYCSRGACDQCPRGSCACYKGSHAMGKKIARRLKREKHET